MALPIGQIFVPSGADEIRSDFLRDIRLEAIVQGLDADDVPVQPGSDWHVLGTAVANVALIQYANIRISDDNSDLLRATGDGLDAKREGHGLPEAGPSPASGSLIIGIQGGGPVTIPDGEQFLLPNGLRGKVAGQQLGVLDGASIPVVTIDTGDAANLAGSAKVKFISPPVNVKTEATVDPNDPLTGGLDAETDERKRDRILNRLRNIPAGGNFGQMIEVALNALASLQQVYVYPALGGPASTKVVLLRDYDEAENDFSRVPSVGAAQIVRTALHAAFPSPMEIVVQAVAQEPTDAAIKLTIPDAALAGGSGTGWLDAVVWPPLIGADGGRIFITAVASATSITITAQTATAPTAGQTHIMWWSRVDQRFYTRLVTAFAGGAGAWILTLDSALTASDGTLPQALDFVSPAAVNADGYGKTWLASLRTLGPHENTTDSNRIPRALRHPFIATGVPSALTIAQLTALRNAHSEIVDTDWSHRSLITPTIPISVDSPPNVLGPRRFAVYKQ